jgi:hypothetical protein
MSYEVLVTDTWCGTDEFGILGACECGKDCSIVHVRTVGNVRTVKVYCDECSPLYFFKAKRR